MELPPKSYYLIENIPLHVRLLLKRLGVLVIPYEICRIIFYIYNHAYFSQLHFSEICYYLWVGLRFDISAILMSNLLFIILCFLPFGTEESIYRRYILKMVYLLTNSVALFFQMGDCVFFTFVFKRSTADIFKFLGLGDDTTNVMGSVIMDYWFMILAWILLVALIYFLYYITGKEMFIKRQEPYTNTKHYYKATSISSYFVFSLFIVLGCRGGWQQKSLSIPDALAYAPAHDIPLVLNSPFTIISTLNQPALEDENYFNTTALKTWYSPAHKPLVNDFRRLNVVTIILESFSKEYIGALNNRHVTYTPFLDSLISQSLVCDNAFSDGKKSIEGIPAVVASLPSWMNNPFITSPYSHDHTNSLASILGNLGYTTAFFHGGHNGSMGFDKFCKQAGFKYYLGMKEYPDAPTDYDGNWGIWDEPYFQYFASSLDTMPQPFYAAIFSISSHHPFGIPAKYKNEFVHKPGDLKIHACIEYSDMALRKFFERVSKMPWFDSTLFVITADHAGPSNDPFYSNRLGMYEIPIIYYRHNSSLKGVSNVTTQHADILPSVLDYLHYPVPYFAFGKSIFDTNANHIAVNFIGDVYEIIKSPWCLQMGGDSVCGLYNYRKDSMLKNNLVQRLPHTRDSLSNTLKAVIQAYNNSILHDRML